MVSDSLILLLVILYKRNVHINVKLSHLLERMQPQSWLMFDYNPLYFIEYFSRNMSMGSLLGTIGRRSYSHVISMKAVLKPFVIRKMSVSAIVFFGALLDFGITIFQ